MKVWQAWKLNSLTLSLSKTSSQSWLARKPPTQTVNSHLHGTHMVTSLRTRSTLHRSKMPSSYNRGRKRWQTKPTVTWENCRMAPVAWSNNDKDTRPLQIYTTKRFHVRTILIWPAVQRVWPTLRTKESLTARSSSSLQALVSRSTRTIACCSTMTASPIERSIHQQSHSLTDATQSSLIARRIS